MILSMTTALAENSDPAAFWWGLPLALGAVALGAWGAGVGRVPRKSAVRR